MTKVKTNIINRNAVAKTNATQRDRVLIGGGSGN